MVYIKERYYFSLFEVKVDIQKGAPRFSKKIIKNSSRFIQFTLCYSMTCVLGSNYYELSRMEEK